MQTEAEVRYNCAVFSDQQPDPAVTAQIQMQKRKLLIQEWCEGCGTCVEACKGNALSLQNGKATVDPDRCVFCGYCARVCPQFCIKVI